MNKPTRRQLLRMALSGATLATLAPFAAETSRLSISPGSAETPRLNVLFIAVDDLRPELGCYGHRQMKTPHIDTLARAGYLMTRHYVQYAVCGPSRDCLLTGLRPDSNGTTDNVHSFRENLPDWVSLPEYFAGHGYRTVKTGKISHTDRDDKAFQNVLNEWTQPNVSLYNAPANKAELLKHMDQIQEKERSGQPLTPHERYVLMIGPHYEWSDAPDNAYPDGGMADLAIEELGRMKDSRQPTFLAVGFHRPHLPFNCPKKYWDLYDPEKLELPENGRPPEAVPPIAMMKYDELGDYPGAPRKDSLDEAQARRMIHGYHACVSFIDAQVGRLLQALEVNGLAQNTVVVLWGDHGWHLGEHGLWGKDTNFEEATRSPLIVRSPLLKGGQQVTGFTETVDLYPTLCELAGLPLPERLEGLSFVPLLRDPDRAWKSAAFSQIRRGDIVGYSLRTERYRFNRWTNRTNQQGVGDELYDRQTDPEENHNLAERPGNEKLVAQLAAQLAAGWRAALPNA